MLNQEGNSLIVGILIGLLVAGGLFGAYYLGTKNNNSSITPTTSQTTTASINLTPSTMPASNNETASWQTYTSSKLSYTVKYPPSWKLEESQASDNYVYFYSDVPFSEGLDGGLYYVFTTYYSNPEQKNFKDLVKSIGNLDDNFMTNFQYKESTINGIKTFETESLPSAYGAYNTFFQDKNGNLIGLSLAPFETDNRFQNQDSQFKIYQQMLQTFKFN